MNLPRTLAILTATALAAGTLTAPAAHAQPADEEIGSLMLVLDASGSMRDPDGTGTTRIAAAHKALTTVVENLPAHATVGMRVFGAQITGTPMPQEACQDTQRVVDLGTDNRAQLLSAISTYQPHGWTPIPEALRQAANDLGPEGKRHIILVSDGESTCDPDPCEVAADIAAQGIGLTIDVVGLNVDDNTRRQLTCIADAGNGEYVDATNADELTAALNHTTTRATRPFEYNGTPVEGTAEPIDAPDISPGLWSDELGTSSTPEAVRHYRVKRTMRGSTLQASALGLLSREHPDGMELHFVTMDGDSCGPAGVRTGGGVSQVLTTVETRSTQLCQDEEELVLRLARRTVEVPVGEMPVELRVREIPPLAGTGSTEPQVGFEGPRVPASETPVELTPGSSMSTAPLLTTGQSITASILPDEVQTYRIPAGWGQAVRATLEQPTRIESVPGDLPGSLRLQLIHPSGHLEAGSRAVPVYGGGEVTDETTAMWPGGSQGADPAGDVVVVVYWHGGTDREREPVGYTLTAEVAGELLEAPEYLAEPLAAVDSPEPQPTDSEPSSPSPEPAQEKTPQTAPSETAPETTETQTSSDEDDGSSSTPLILAGLGGLLVIGGGVAAALLLRRRR